MAEKESKERPREHDSTDFFSKLKELLPEVSFEETAEIREARTAVLEMLKRNDQDPALRKFVWAEYASIFEHVVDTRTVDDAKSPLRAKLQIATIVHKALLFREVGNMQRYFEELVIAEDYAFNSYLDTIAEPIGRELDKFS